MNTPGGTTDSKQLTRVFRGCKINEWEISSTVDAELKFRATFDALSCYTDTGRLESSNAGDRYIAHRMFQNTGETDTNRKIAGIASGEEKPFMFYNGTIEAFGQSIGFISSFELRGKTGVELFHTIQSNPVGEDVQSSTGLSTKQVPYGGTRNASIIREGREQLDMEIDVVLTDPNLFHQLRSHNETSSGVDASPNKQIKLHFTKPYSGTIDSDYRGEIKVIFSTLGKEEYAVHKGDRIAQMVINKVEQISWVTVETGLELESSERGSGGFGSTGV